MATSADVWLAVARSRATGQNWYEHDDEGARLAYDQGKSQPTGAAIFGLFCRSGPNSDYYQAPMATRFS